MPVSTSAPLLGVAVRGGVTWPGVEAGEGVRRRSLLCPGCWAVGNKEGVENLGRWGRCLGVTGADRRVGKASIERLVAMGGVFRFCFAMSSEMFRFVFACTGAGRSVGGEKASVTGGRCR
jgi:hypothetical protein